MKDEKILGILDELGPVKFKTLARHLEIDNRDKKDFADYLRELERRGLIVLYEDKYYPVDSKHIFEGYFQGTSKGFGFLLRGEKDIFIPAEDKNKAMDKDKVLVLMTKCDEAHNAYEGKVIKVLKRNNKKIVGTFQSSKNYGFVLPQNERIGTDIFIPGKYTGGAKNGQTVVASIRKWDNMDESPEGEIVEILGYPRENGVDILTIARQFNLPEDFTSPVKKEVKKLPEKVSEKDIKTRRDFRKDIVFTIDGKDSKDFDDAVSITKDEDFYYLNVHIADVAHYVKPGTAIDEEALRRGNSYYLLTEVIPMLPKEISNGICSLNENEDRLTLSVLMKVDKKGKVVDHEICEGVINSTRRLVYDDVSDFLEKGEKHPSLKGLYDDLKIMEELQKILFEKRYKRGAIDFNFSETQIDLDDKGNPIDVYPRDRRIANKIIEEFMILTNEVVAEEYFWLELPFIYRVHEEPKVEKITDLNQMIRPLGLKVRTLGDINPVIFQDILKEVEGKDEEVFVSTLVLRTMQKARYDTIELGHFGLGAKYYSHFTSPIRRYSDLTIHRIIKENIHGKITKKRINYYEGVLLKIAKQVSDTEIIQDDSERAVKNVKMAQYMEDKIGEVYEGTISGVTSFGIFVELPNTIEGLMAYQNIDEYFEYDENTRTAVSKDTSKIYKIGDKVKVKVLNVNVEKAQIDFEPANR